MSVGDGEFSDIHGQSGLMSFYRLICSIYFTKHCTAFLPYSNPEALFDSFSAEDVHDRHILEEYFRKTSKNVLLPKPLK
jgi:hypothetical protein